MTDAGRESLVRWQSAVWAFRPRSCSGVYDAHPADRRVLVRYEDLVADPARELARICTYLAIDASADRLAEVAAEHAYDAVPRPRRATARRSARPRPAAGATT